MLVTSITTHEPQNFRSVPGSPLLVGWKQALRTRRELNEAVTKGKKWEAPSLFVLMKKFLVIRSQTTLQVDCPTLQFC